MNWELCKQDFVWDGSWRDIYVFNMSLQDWDRLLQACGVWGYQATFCVDGACTDLPSSSQRAFALRQTASPLLRLQVGAVELCCHFFTPDEIEFDLDPREVQSERKFNHILTFMRRLGQLLDKPVALTPENGPEYPIITYMPAADTMQYYLPTSGNCCRLHDPGVGG